MLYPLKPTYDFFMRILRYKYPSPQSGEFMFPTMKIMENFRTAYIKAKSSFLLNFISETKYCFG